MGLTLLMPYQIRRWSIQPNESTITRVSEDDPSMKREQTTYIVLGSLQLQQLLATQTTHTNRMSMMAWHGRGVKIEIAYELIV
jgi:hypothetical protein